MQPVDDPDEIMDDVFVLWRAFESTIKRSTGQKDAPAAIDAVADVINTLRIEKLPCTARWIDQLKVFHTASSEEFVEWFQQEDSAVHHRTARLRDIEDMRAAVAKPSSWTRKNSRAAGRIVYQMRCAVIHSSLQTDNRLATRVLPALRSAVIELAMGRAAVAMAHSLDSVTAEFDDALEKQN